MKHAITKKNRSKLNGLKGLKFELKEKTFCLKTEKRVSFKNQTRIKKIGILSIN